MSKLCVGLLIAVGSLGSTAWAQQPAPPSVNAGFLPDHSAEVIFIKVIDKTDASVPPASGTGTSLQNGYVLTAKHVINAFGAHETNILGVVGGRYGDSVPLDLVVLPPDPLDLALLKFREVPAGSKAVQIGNPNSLTVGSVLITLSFPGEYGLTMSPTQVIGAGKAGDWRAAAELLPGSSGGPVFDPKGGQLLAIVENGAPGTSEILPINLASMLLISAGYGFGPLATALGFQDSQVKDLLKDVATGSHTDPVAVLSQQVPKKATQGQQCENKLIPLQLVNPQNSASKDLEYTVQAEPGCKIESAQYRSVSQTRAQVTPAFSNSQARLKVHLDGVPLFGARSWAQGEFTVTQVPATY